MNLSDYTDSITLIICSVLILLYASGKLFNKGTEGKDTNTAVLVIGIIMLILGIIEGVRNYLQ